MKIRLYTLIYNLDFIGLQKFYWVYRNFKFFKGNRYTSSIDMWSLGCIVAELFLGLPLFPGSSQYNQIRRIVDMLGVPPSYMCEKGKHSSDYFNKELKNGKIVFTLKSMAQYMEVNLKFIIIRNKIQLNQRQRNT